MEGERENFNQLGERVMVRNRWLLDERQRYLYRKDLQNIFNLVRHTLERKTEKSESYNEKFKQILNFIQSQTRKIDHLS